MQIRSKLLKILEESGIYIDEEEKKKDIDLRDYITDSIQFVGFIVEIEEELNMEFPNDLLLFDQIASLNGFANTIESIMLGECMVVSEQFEYSGLL